MTSSFLTASTSSIDKASTPENMFGSSEPYPNENTSQNTDFAVSDKSKLISNLNALC